MRFIQMDTVTQSLYSCWRQFKQDKMRVGDFCAHVCELGIGTLWNLIEQQNRVDSRFMSVLSSCVAAIASHKSENSLALKSFRVNACRVLEEIVDEANSATYLEVLVQHVNRVIRWIHLVSSVFS